MYSKLWKYQQENRLQLVDAGLKRWEVGDIASRIGQLYYNYYLRTSDVKFLTEAFIFYEAILTRDYFKDDDKDAFLANKQLRYFARFIVICLLLNRREKVQLLMRELRTLVGGFSRTCQARFLLSYQAINSFLTTFTSLLILNLSEDSHRVWLVGICLGCSFSGWEKSKCWSLGMQGIDAKEWRVVVQEIVRFMKADAACDMSRPLRYSVLLDSHPSSIPVVEKLEGAKPLRLEDAILASYYHKEASSLLLVN